MQNDNHGASHKGSFRKNHHDILSEILHLFAHNQLQIDDLSSQALDELTSQVHQDIRFLDDRIERIHNTFAPNPLILETYENMKHRRETLLNWVENQRQPIEIQLRCAG